MTRAVIGYGVVRQYPPHLTAVFRRKAEAEKKAEELGPQYQVKLAAYRLKGGSLQL